jgi:hypothetical protein
MRSTLGTILFATAMTNERFVFGRKRAEGESAVSMIDFRVDPTTARSYRVVSLVTHVDIPDIVWADDESGCYGVQGRDAKGKPIVVERFGPIRIVTARR